MLLEDYESAVIVMSDEAYFHLSGEINKQNFRYWSPGVFFFTIIPVVLRLLTHLRMVLRLG
ncbi:unnamed protein product, partial [Callosobruchus maculatus]